MIEIPTVGRKILLLALATLLLTPACAKHFSVRGMVLSVNAADHTVIVSHRDIPRYMPAMSMPFRVRKPAELTGLYPGAQIEFDLVTRKSGSHIERLRRVGSSSVIEDQGDRITLPPNPDRIAIGETMPDFA